MQIYLVNEYRKPGEPVEKSTLLRAFHLASDVDVRIAELEDGLRKISEHCSEVRGGAPPHVWIPSLVRSLMGS